ncbi:ABC transporter ATP-binding protein [Candidatus Sumerlaeota bacterium]|nr:ABC transporter ATP-binding protein [Candidatus Sumerlaeota bacterium]
MARVLLQNVSKKYPGVEKPAVDRVSIEINDLEFMVLVGPSGCGKSTTLRMVAGLEDATEGDIYIGEKRVNDVAPKDRDIAMIFQNYALYPHMTVYKNLAFPLERRKVPKSEIDRRVREAAELLGISEYLDRKPKALSGGQRQLSKLHRRLKSTMIYVTHDQVEAMTMGDRIVVMNDGRVQQMDQPKTIYDKPKNKFVAGFIGSPPMNFIRGERRGSGEAMRFGAGNLEFPISPAHRASLEKHGAKEVILGLRPEDFSEHAAGETMAEVTAEIENIEPLGAEAIFYLNTGAGGLIVRLQPDAQGKIGETKRLYPNLSKAHFFDAKTEERIGD